MNIPRRNKTNTDLIPENISFDATARSLTTLTSIKMSWHQRKSRDDVVVHVRKIWRYENMSSRAFRQVMFFKPRPINLTFYLHLCVLHLCTVVAFTGRTATNVPVHMRMAVQPQHFHSALGRAQIYCMAPCALRWTFTGLTHTVCERARGPDLVWLCSNVLGLDGCPACITLSNDTKMETWGRPSS